jgi:hypothetical protein
VRAQRTRSARRRRKSFDAISGRGKRIGIAPDLPAWTLAGIKPAEALEFVKIG